MDMTDTTTRDELISLWTERNRLNTVIEQIPMVDNDDITGTNMGFIIFFGLKLYDIKEKTKRVFKYLSENDIQLIDNITTEIQAIYDNSTVFVVEDVDLMYAIGIVSAEYIEVVHPKLKDLLEITQLEVLPNLEQTVRLDSHMNDDGFAINCKRCFIAEIDMRQLHIAHRKHKQARTEYHGAVKDFLTCVTNYIKFIQSIKEMESNVLLDIRQRLADIWNKHQDIESKRNIDSEHMKDVTKCVEQLKTKISTLN
jgi:hypothetical protein